MYDEIIWGLILFIGVISIYVWINIIRNTEVPIGSIYSTREESPQKPESNILKDFYFIPYLNVTNSSTTLTDQEGALYPEQMAPKCQLFGTDCIGFDTNGHLLLTKDKRPNYVNVRSLNSLLSSQPQIKSFEDGFYQYLPNKGSSFNDMCVKQFEGKIEGNKCTLSDLQLDKLVNQLNKNV